jgi:hypothetical protein
MAWGDALAGGAQGAGSGASIGAAIGNAPGAAIGAGIGAVAGAIKGYNDGKLRERQEDIRYGAGLITAGASTAIINEQLTQDLYARKQSVASSIRRANIAQARIAAMSGMAGMAGSAAAFAGSATSANVAAEYSAVNEGRASTMAIAGQQQVAANAEFSATNTRNEWEKENSFTAKAGKFGMGVAKTMGNIFRIQVSRKK